MFVKSLRDCPALIANDGCRVFELLHEKNDPVDLPYSMAVAEVACGERSYRHRLEQAEVYYVLSGQGLMHIDEATRAVGEGDAVLIPAGAVQFLALVSPPWTADGDERLESENLSSSD
jgi:quercetin dioxygenase-like cupin family protein